MKDLARKHKADHIWFFPEVVYQTYSSTGEPGDIVGRETFDFLATHTNHSGLTYGYTNCVSWRYLKDLSSIHNEAELLASYSKNTRRNVKIARSAGVKTVTLQRSELGRFMNLYVMALDKHGVQRHHPITYFESLLDSFGSKSMVRLAYVDLQEYKDSWISKLEEYQFEENHLESKLSNARKPERIKTQLQDIKSKIASAKVRIAEADNLINDYGASVDLAASSFIQSGKELIYFQSGSDPDPRLTRFYAQTLLQHEAMLYCLEHHISTYDFYGIEGYFNKADAAGNGVLAFKQGFNGYIHRMVGECELPVNVFKYQFKRIIKRLLKRA